MFCWQSWIAPLTGLEPNPVAGTPGLLSVRRYLADGWQTLIF